MEPIKQIELKAGRAETWSNGAENCAVDLTYDLSSYLKMWPNAQPTVAFERADGEKYPHEWTRDGNTLHIPVTITDTATAGVCRCVITMRNGDGRANTVVFTGRVAQGIDSLGEVPDEPLRGIIEQINEAVVRCETAAEAINANVLEQLRKV